MNCDFIHENILDYLDGKLHDPDLGRFKSHLTGCGQCNELVKEIRLTYQFAERPINLQVRDSFVEKTTEQAFRQEARIVPMLYQVLKPIAVAASIGLGILVGNGELTMLNTEDNSITNESVVMSTTAAADYSLWQSFEDYGNEN